MDELTIKKLEVVHRTPSIEPLLWTTSTSFTVSSFPFISYFFMFKSFAHYGYTVLGILKDATTHEPKLYRK